MTRLVRIGITRMLDAMQESEQKALAELLAKLVKEGAVPEADFMTGLQSNLDQLGDLM